MIKNTWGRYHWKGRVSSTRSNYSMSSDVVSLMQLVLDLEGGMMKQGPRGEAGEITYGLTLNKNALLQESWRQANKDECGCREVTSWWDQRGWRRSSNKAVEEANDSSSKFGVVRSGPLVRVDGNQVIDGKQYLRLAIKYRTSGSSKCSVQLTKRMGIGAEQGPRNTDSNPEDDLRP